jgi:hypothetical protein
LLEVLPHKQRGARDDGGGHARAGDAHDSAGVF